MTSFIAEFQSSSYLNNDSFYRIIHQDNGAKSASSAVESKKRSYNIYSYLWHTACSLNLMIGVMLLLSNHQATFEKLFEKSVKAKQAYLVV